MKRLIDSLTYQPEELGFGTSGLRGTLESMTDLECYINAIGFLTYVESFTDTIETVYIAGDLRASTPRIMSVMARAIEDMGMQYINCGMIPTPALAYYAMQKNAPCIMVTGSHIPDDRNGIKFYKSDGEILKADEKAIRSSVGVVRTGIYQEPSELFNNDGSFANPLEITSAEESAEKIYIDRYLDYFGRNCLVGTKLVMYQHSAVGRDLIPSILESMGAKVVLAERSDKFIPIDTENVTPSDEKMFKRLAEEYPDTFAIISTDGDSDRPFVVDETGRFHRGDVLGYVVCDYLGSKAVAIPVSSNDAVVDALSNDGIMHKLTKIGSPHVIVAMQDLKKEYKNVSGWEVNGGFLTGEDYFKEGNTLLALPTRDAFLPILCALLSAKEKSLKISELFSRLPQRFTQAGLIDNFPSAVSAEIVRSLSSLNEQSQNIIEQVFYDTAGFGRVVDIDSTDGVRITFSNNDIAHLRPSGNAPQLRIYSNADTQERADEIVALAIAEPDGMLRRLESKIT